MKIEDNELEIHKQLLEQHGDETANQLIKNSRTMDGWVDFIESRSTEYVVSTISQMPLYRNIQIIPFKQYKQKAISELMEWFPDFDMSRVSVSQSDISKGSPKKGDMIARNPKNHDDKWLVARVYFEDNFEEYEGCNDN